MEGSTPQLGRVRAFRVALVAGVGTSKRGKVILTTHGAHGRPRSLFSSSFEKYSVFRDHNRDHYSPAHGLSLL